MSQTRTPVLVDGPNLVNRLIDLGIRPKHIARQLSGRELVRTLGNLLSASDALVGACKTAEFFHSPKRFGPINKRFTQDEQQTLLDRLGGEEGIYLEEVNLGGSTEKGVDTMITTRLLSLKGSGTGAVLVTSDRDFVPAIDLLRHDVAVVCVAVDPATHPIQLRRAAYQTIDLKEHQAGLFTYSYPRVRVSELDEESCAVLYSEADDRTFNQLRVTRGGDVYLQAGQVRPDPLLQFRFETFCPGNGYVGPLAASDEEYIAQQTSEIRQAWEQRAEGFID